MTTQVRQVQLPTIPQLAAVVRPGLAWIVWKGLATGAIDRVQGRRGMRKFLEATDRPLYTAEGVVARRWRGMEPGTRLVYTAFGGRRLRGAYWYSGTRWYLVEGQDAWIIVLAGSREEGTFFAKVRDL